MRQVTFIAVDQYGHLYKLYTEHPRKELMDLFGAKHADKMYIDREHTMHIGWVIMRLWLHVHRVYSLHSN